MKIDLNEEQVSLILSVLAGRREDFAWRLGRFPNHPSLAVWQMVVDAIDSAIAALKLGKDTSTQS